MCWSEPEVPVITTAYTFVLVVRVKFCVVLPALFVALKLTLDVPATVGVPLRTPPPDVLAVNVTPAGKLPLSVTTGVGVPVVVTVNDPAAPTANVVLFALVKTGG